MTLGAAETHIGNSRWFVVHTQPHAERRALRHLQQQGYDVYCPNFVKTVRHARKVDRVLAPLFPNYLFVRLDMGRDLWRSINGTTGVVGLVMAGDLPRPVPRGIVETLQDKFDPGGSDDRALFAPGQAVKIMKGPFANFVGKLERLNPAGRVQILLDLLGRSVSITLHEEVLEPAA